MNNGVGIVDADVRLAIHPKPQIWIDDRYFFTEPKLLICVCRADEIEIIKCDFVHLAVEVLKIEIGPAQQCTFCDNGPGKNAASVNPVSHQVHVSNEYRFQI